MTRFFFTFCQIFAKNEEKHYHENLWMCRPYITYGSVSEAGDFSICVKKLQNLNWQANSLTYLIIFNVMNYPKIRLEALFLTCPPHLQIFLRPCARIIIDMENLLKSNYQDCKSPTL